MGEDAYKDGNEDNLYSNTRLQQERNVAENIKNIVVELPGKKKGSTIT
jgi:hypothetical protein